MQELATPGKQLETQRGSPIASAETPEVAHHEKQDPHPRGSGTEVEDQTAKGARPFLPLPKKSSNNQEASTKETGPGAEPIIGSSLATRDWGDETVGTTDLKQDIDPVAGNSEPGKDHAAKGSEGNEAGRRMSTAAEAAITVLGK